MKDLFLYKIFTNEEKLVFINTIINSKIKELFTNMPNNEVEIILNDIFNKENVFIKVYNFKRNIRLNNITIWWIKIIFKFWVTFRT